MNGLDGWMDWLAGRMDGLDAGSGGNHHNKTRTELGFLILALIFGCHISAAAKLKAFLNDSLVCFFLPFCEFYFIRFDCGTHPQ